MPSSGRQRRSGSRSGTGRLALAQLILFFVGMVTVFVSGFGLRDWKEDVIQVTAGLVSEPKPGETPEGHAKEVEAMQEELGRRIRIAHSITIGVGLVFIGCALLVNQLPVFATVTGLVLFLLTSALLGFVDPALLMQGILLRIAIVIALITAVRSAIRVERRENRRRRRREEDGDPRHESRA